MTFLLQIVKIGHRCLNVKSYWECLDAFPWQWRQQNEQSLANVFASNTNRMTDEEKYDLSFYLYDK